MDTHRHISDTCLQKRTGNPFSECPKAVIGCVIFSVGHPWIGFHRPPKNYGNLRTAENPLRLNGQSFDTFTIGHLAADQHCGALHEWRKSITDGDNMKFDVKPCSRPEKYICMHGEGRCDA